MSSWSQWIKVGVLLTGITLLLAALAACTTVNTKHPQLMPADITAEQKAQLAAVYFIRPQAYKTKGISDQAVRISFQNQTLLTQDEASYTLLYMKPSKGILKVHSKTKFINADVPVDVWRSRQYKFIAGKTYFIYVRQIDEEFRGVFYEPEPVTLEQAKELIVPGKGRFGNTRATGLARSAPLEKLSEVVAPPASAVKGLTPALPENIYKQEKYLPKQETF